MKTIKSVLLLLVGLTAILSSGCKNDEDIIPVQDKGELRINMGFNVDGSPLILDSLLYSNEAGYAYKVTKIEYYISNIRLINTNGPDYILDSVHYVNYIYPEWQQLVLKNIPFGNYSGISFLVGLDDSHNISNFLPATMENLNMAWPEPMGGGYHFMKFEGFYIDSLSTEQGFAMHLGRNGNFSECSKTVAIRIGGYATNLSLSMNLNEWFRDPNTWDFAVDGSYIMGDTAALRRLSENGDDVFAE